MGTCLQEGFASADGRTALAAPASALFDFNSPIEIRPVQPGMERVVSAIDVERRRLGQELHDSAGQLLACLQLSIARLEDESPEQACLIHEIQGIAHEISDEIRSLAFLHYPVELTDRGLAATLAGLARGFSSRTSIKVEYSGNDDVSELGDAGALALLRVAQEALVNVYRHSKASSAKVSLRLRGRSIELTICDNGIGLSEPSGSSSGIGKQSMRHRVETLGGSFRFVNLKHGLKVFASVPIAA
jgi:two-component system NarL family sensor kinase